MDMDMEVCRGPFSIMASTVLFRSQPCTSLCRQGLALVEEEARNALV